MGLLHQKLHARQLFHNLYALGFCLCFKIRFYIHRRNDCASLSTYRLRQWHPLQLPQSPPQAAFPLFFPFTTLLMAKAAQPTTRSPTTNVPIKPPPFPYFVLTAICNPASGAWRPFEGRSSRYKNPNRQIAAANVPTPNTPVVASVPN